MLEKQSLSVSLRMLCGVKSNIQYLNHVAQSYDCYDCCNSTMVALSFLMKGFFFFGMTNTQLDRWIGLKI